MLFLLGWVGIALGQETNIKSGGNYYFNYIPQSALSNIENSSTAFQSHKDEIISILDGTSFNIHVTKIENGKIYFVFGEFKGETAALEPIINQLNFDEESLHPKGIFPNVPSNSYNTKRTVYSLPLDTFEKNTKPLYDRVEYRAGAYTVPFKLRLSSFSFDSNINIGANIGAKIRWNRKTENGFALEPILGFGLASIKLDESNSNTTEATNISAFTMIGGVLVHLTNNINCGLTLGFDKISGKDQDNYHWKYNGKGWIGIGINISFGAAANNTGMTKSNQ